MDETTDVYSTTTEDDSSWAFLDDIGLPLPLFIVVICCCFLALVISISCIAFCCCSKKEGKGTSHLDRSKSLNKKNSYLNMAVPVEKDGAGASSKQKPTGDLQLDIMDKLEHVMKKQIDTFCLESSRLTLKEAIGSGRFGIVYKAVLTDKDLKNPEEVAAKTVAGEDCHEKEASDFLEEVIRMRGFHHRNVLSMVGLVLRDNRPYAVLPYMKNGDLRTYLKDVSKKMVVRDLVAFCSQIADGMCYLSEQGFVHRDLATRNCMVDEHEIIKIADFGLSRDIFRDDYYRMENLDQPLPVRWMAVESIGERIFTVKTDVWSYGVVMWEVMTRGQTPYSEKDNHEVAKHIQTGGRPLKPQYCPDEVFAVMQQCWKEFSGDRPDFRELCDELRDMLSGPTSKTSKKRDKYYNLTEVHAYATKKKSPKKK